MGWGKSSPLNGHLGRTPAKNVASKVTRSSGDFRITYSSDQKSGGLQSTMSSSEKVTKMRKLYYRVQAAT